MHFYLLVCDIKLQQNTLIFMTVTWKKKSEKVQGLWIHLQGRYFKDKSYCFVCTQAPHTLQMRAGVKMGDVSLQDSMVADGLTDAFHNYHMGITGLSLCNSLTTQPVLCTLVYQWIFVVDHPSINSWERREAVGNQSRAAGPLCCQFSKQSRGGTESRTFWSGDCPHHGAIQKRSITFSVALPLFLSSNATSKLFSPLGPIEVKTDEFPRHGSSIETMSKLKPCFVKDSSGTVTAGNASGSGVIHEPIKQTQDGSLYTHKALILILFLQA